jgi:hypothetical protein
MNGFGVGLVCNSGSVLTLFRVREFAMGGSAVFQKVFSVRALLRMPPVDSALDDALLLSHRCGNCSFASGTESELRIHMEAHKHYSNFVSDAKRVADGKVAAAKSVAEYISDAKRVADGKAAAAKSVAEYISDAKRVADEKAAAAKSVAEYRELYGQNKSRPNYEPPQRPDAPPSYEDAIAGNI